MTEIKIVQSTPSELQELIELSVKSQLDEIKKNLSQNNQNDKILSKDETAKFLKIDLSTLYRWTKKGKIKAFGIGNRVYYSMSDIMNALIPLN